MIHYSSTPPEYLRYHVFAMRLRNITKKTVISKNCKIALSLYDRLIGLLDSRNPRTLIFFTRWGIHTFFMKTPIDVLILDNNLRVRQVKELLQPNKLFLYNPIFSKIIELPPGTIGFSSTAINDKIHFG